MTDQRPSKTIADQAGQTLTKDLDDLRGALKPQQEKTSWRLPAGLLALTAILLSIIAWFGVGNEPKGPDLIYDYGFRDSALPEESAWIEQAISRSLASQISQTGHAKIVNATPNSPWSNIEPDKGSVKSLTGADWVLESEIRQQDTQLTLVVTAQNLSATNHEHTLEIVGSTNAIGDLTNRTASALLDVLGKPYDSAINSGFPTDTKSAQAYTLALTAIDLGDGDTALDHLNEALAITQDNPLLLSARAQAWTLQGYSQRAEEDAKRAFDLRDGLSREMELTLEAHLLETSGDWVEAANKWQALHQFYPDDLDYGLELVRAQTKADLFVPGLETVNALKALPTPLNEDPRIDLSLSRIHTRAGRYSAALETADQALARARNLNAPALVAEIQLAAVAADAPDKYERLQEARTIYNDIHSPRGVAMTLKELGDLTLHTGKIADAVQYYELSIKTAGTARNPPLQAAAQNALAIAHDLQGDLLKGYQAKLSVADYYRHRNVKSRHSIMLENIGISLFKLGRYEEALQHFDEALEIFETIGDEIGIAWAPYHRARIAIRQGELVEGEKLIKTAISNAETNPEGNLELNSKFELMLVNRFAGRRESAQTQAETLSQSYKSLELFLDAAETDTHLGLILLRLGATDEAEERLTDALKVQSEAGAKYYAASAQIGLVDLALSRSANTAHEDSCENLKKLTQGLQHKLMRLNASTRLVACEIWGDGAPNEQHITQLAEVIEAASEAELFEPAFMATQMMARLNAVLGNSDLATIQLDSLNEITQQKGWAAASYGCLTASPFHPCQQIASTDN